MGWFVALCAVGTGVACVAAVGLVGFIIYKTLENAQKHKAGNSPGASDVRVTELVTFDDLKSENTELRRRNSNSADKKDATVKTMAVPKPPRKTCEGTQTTDVTAQQKNIREQGTQTVNVSSFLSDSHQETQTAISTPSNNSFCNVIGTQTDLPNHLSVDQNAQTTDSLLNVDVTFGTNNINIGQIEENIQNDGAESSYSVGSYVSVSSISRDTCKYPSWGQMTEAEREACLCKVCQRKVTTVTYPCRHPYFCGECAPTFFKFYNHRCPKCKKRIKSYDNIY